MCLSGSADLLVQQKIGAPGFDPTGLTVTLMLALAYVMSTLRHWHFTDH